MPRPRPFRLPFVRRPRDASSDYDDASYDGGTAGGPYLRHVLILVVVLVIIGVVVHALL